jgi:hypothetical protein
MGERERERKKRERGERLRKRGQREKEKNHHCFLSQGTETCSSVQHNLYLKMKFCGGTEDKDEGPILDFV